MHLRELVDLQREFDRRHAGRFEWAESVEARPDEILQFLLVALVGEVGEIANLVKKVARGDCTFESVRSDIRSELADVFIYILKMSHQMNVDLESAFLDKLKLNEDRFKLFEHPMRGGSMEALRDFKHLTYEDRVLLLEDIASKLPNVGTLLSGLGMADVHCESGASGEMVKKEIILAIPFADAMSSEDVLGRQVWASDLKEFLQREGLSFERSRIFVGRSSDVERLIETYLLQLAGQGER